MHAAITSDWEVTRALLGSSLLWHPPHGKSREHSWAPRSFGTHSTSARGPSRAKKRCTQSGQVVTSPPPSPSDNVVAEALQGVIPRLRNKRTFPFLGTHAHGPTLPKGERGAMRISRGKFEECTFFSLGTGRSYPKCSCAHATHIFLPALSKQVMRTFTARRRGLRKGRDGGRAGRRQGRRVGDRAAARPGSWAQVWAHRAGETAGVPDCGVFPKVCRSCRNAVGTL